MGDRALSHLDDDEFNSVIQGRREKRMGAIDKMAPEVRSLVHDYGYNVVITCLDCGVTKPARIRHVVETILDEFSPTRGTGSAQGVRSRT